MIEIQQKSIRLTLTTSHILGMKTKIKQQKINCKTFMSKKDSNYFFTGMYMRYIAKTVSVAYIVVMYFICYPGRLSLFVV